MSITPPLNRFLFTLFLLLTLAVGVSALIWPAVRSEAYAPLRDLLFPNLFLPTRAGMPVALTLAAPPELEGWVKESAADFTRQNPLMQIQVVQLNGIDAPRRLSTLTAQPDIWIAEADFVRIAAGSLPYEASGTPLALDAFRWAGVKGRAELPGSVSWMSLAQAAKNPQLRIALPPAASVEGMAACWAAAGEYFHQPALSAAQIGDAGFHTWLQSLAQAAPDRNRSVLDQLSTRPPQVSVGLILNSDWRQLSQDAFVPQALEYSPAFNYPYSIRSDWLDIPADEASDRQAAARAFRSYLLSSGPQSRLATYGLAPAKSNLTGRLPLLDEPAIRALRFCWQ
jgi:hypothetical protein